MPQSAIVNGRPAVAGRKQNARDAGVCELAEREGFEPSSRETREPDFESGAIDHSATFPDAPGVCCGKGAIVVHRPGRRGRPRSAVAGRCVE